jgi:hypothetical protein
LYSQSGKRKSSTETVSAGSKRSKDTIVVDVEVKTSIFTSIILALSYFSQILTSLVIHNVVISG